MLLREILREECFKDATIVAAEQCINHEVSSVMILEAIDIEKWGSENQLILTSYYALMGLEEVDLLTFFEKLHHIKISGIILKMDRLVKQVPELLLKNCNKFCVPLILIPQNTKYETIIQAVLQPIINENSRILNSYYNARKTVNQLSLKELSFPDLLNSFKDLMNVDCIFKNESESIFFTTNKNQSQYTVVSVTQLSKIKFVDNQYYQKIIEFEDGHQTTLLTVDIPDILDQKYSFSIFNDFNEMTEDDIMLVENAVELLLTELLKLYAIKKNQSMRKNNQMHDLLLSRFYTIEERDSILNVLEMDHHPYYQGIMISLYGLDDGSDNPIRSPLDPAIEFIRSKFKDVAYFQKNYDIVFLYNFKDKANQFRKELFEPLLHNYEHLYPGLICHIGISSIQKETLESINDNLLNLKKFMRIVDQHSNIVEYDQMGFFKLFYNIESMDELLNYVPNNLMLFIKEKAEFAKTLATFLSLNQNYVKTGERMFIHPKTVRYRIEKAIEQLGLDLDDENMLLSMQVALKICEYLGMLSTD